MELINYTNQWVRGEVQQGRIMIGIAILILLAAILVFKSDHTFLRGMLIPMLLQILVLGGYGSYQVLARPGHVAKVQKVYEKDAKAALQTELDKAEKDDATYTRIKKLWVVLIVVSAILFLVFGKEYYKGLSAGLVLLFTTGLLLDSTLQYRLSTYLEGLRLLA